MVIGFSLRRCESSIPPDSVGRNIRELKSVFGPGVAEKPTKSVLLAFSHQSLYNENAQIHGGIMKQDRFLTGILVGIAVLVVIALAVFFIRKDKQSYISEDAPEGVVHNYVLAVLNKDYQKAYSYLADLENKPTYEQFRDSFLKGMINPNNSAVDVGKSEISGDTASVEVAMIYSQSDPFSTGYRDVQMAILVKQSNGWKLSSMPYYYFWDGTWYPQATATPPSQ
jgi:hypothetical protein